MSMHADMGGTNGALSQGMFEESRTEAVRDHRRHPRPPGEPPVPESQWNELAGQWERWDEAEQGWVVVGDPGPGVDVSYWDDVVEEPGTPT